MNNKKIGLYFTVTAAEKRRIKKNATLCGLKQSEYIRGRALGYAPKAVPPNAFYHFCEKVDALCEKPFSPQVNEKALSLLEKMESIYITTDKEVVQEWQPPAFGS